MDHCATTTVFVLAAVLSTCSAQVKRFPRCPGGANSGALCNPTGTGNECRDYEICVNDPFILRGGICCEIPEGLCAVNQNQGPRCDRSGSGNTCKPGYSCNRITASIPMYKGRQGICCSIPNVCPKGSTSGQACSVNNKNSCPFGSKCRSIPGSYESGVCCTIPAKCPTGSLMGDYCAINNPKYQCKPNYRCLSIPGYKNTGVCCALPKVCSNQGHACRPSGSIPCKPGNTCKPVKGFPDTGVCCPRLCPLGSKEAGRCNTDESCGPGFRCHPVSGSRTGVCCSVPIETPCMHSSFQGRPCNPLLKIANQCGTGHVCQPYKADPTRGACCYKPDVCPTGSLTGPVCSPKPGSPYKLPNCKQGYRCTEVPSKKVGVCCSDNSQGSCPPPSGLPGPCATIFNQCFSDQKCPPFHKCCKEGCGTQCKRAVYDYD